MHSGLATRGLKVQCCDCCMVSRLRTDEQFAGMLHGPSEYPDIELSTASGVQVTYEAYYAHRDTTMSVSHHAVLEICVRVMLR